MRLAASLAAAAALLLTTACETVPPCTECPVVSGNYSVSVQMVPAEKSSCGEMMFSGLQTVVTLVQDGSALVVTDNTQYGNLNLRGTLYEQLLVEFDPISIVNESGDAVRMTMSGSFAGEEGARTLNGTMKFDQAGEEPCKLNVPAIWKQEPVVPEQPL